MLSENLPVPTSAAVERETLHLEFYGARVCSLISEYPIERGYIADQAVLAPLVEFMAAEGWSYSGSGYFSAVFVKGGLALKVGLKPEDSGATYAAWCRANQGKAGVPVIYAIDKFKNCYVVLTDRCYSIRPYLTKGAPEYSANLRNEIDSLRVVIEGGQPLHLHSTTLTAAAIREFFTGIATFDLHRGNVMVDRNGRLVITDPLSYSDNRDSHDESRYTASYGLYEGYTPAD
jgi:hypothetical protein